MIRSLSLLLVVAAATAAATLQAGRSTPAVDGSGPDPDPAAAGAAGRPRIEAVFVLDTTGSMGGMIDAAKRKIWSIASTMASADPAPEIRIGLVAYRDRGDAYVTRRVPLTPDLDHVYAELLKLEARGGGDAPESVNQALYEAVHQMAWSQEPAVYRTVFLVGDAPPHMDYPQDVPWATTLTEARQRDIVVNSLLCGANEPARQAWQAIAAASQGRFLAVDTSGGALELATPYDAEIAALAAELDGTRLSYGSREEREAADREAARDERHRAAAPLPALADRGAFNATTAGEASFAARKDLVSAVASGDVAVEDLPTEALPEPIQALPANERPAAVAKVAQRREQLRGRITELAEERATWLGREMKAEDVDGRSLDRQLLDTLGEQAAAKGLRLGDGD